MTDNLSKKRGRPKKDREKTKKTKITEYPQKIKGNNRTLLNRNNNSKRKNILGEIDETNELNHISDGDDNNEQPDMGVLKKTKENNKTLLSNRNNKLRSKGVIQVPIVISDEINESNYINDDNYERSDVDELLLLSQASPKVSTPSLSPSSMPSQLPSSTHVTQSQSKSFSSTLTSSSLSKTKTKPVLYTTPVAPSQLLNDINKLDLCN